MVYLTEDKISKDLIKDLTFFIDTHPTFKGKIVDDMIKILEKQGYLSIDQWHVLERIYHEWHVAEYIQKKMRLPKEEDENRN